MRFSLGVGKYRYIPVIKGVIRRIVSITSFAQRPERRKCSMSGILEVYLRLVIGKNIRNNSGNCHIVGIDQIMMSPIEHFKCCYQLFFFGGGGGGWGGGAQQLCSEHFPASGVCLHIVNLSTGTGQFIVQ